MKFKKLQTQNIIEFLQFQLVVNQDREENKIDQLIYFTFTPEMSSLTTKRLALLSVVGISSALAGAELVHRVVKPRIPVSIAWFD